MTALTDIPEHSIEEPPLYPMVRQCPLDPPRELLELQAGEQVRHVRIWNGATPLLVTGYELSRQVLSDSRFSGDTAVPGFPSANPGYIARRNVAKSFVNMDNPQHDIMRRSVTQEFTVKRVQALRPRIQQIVDDLIDTMLAGPRPVDLVEALGQPLPALITCDILGVPPVDHDVFFKMARVINTSGSTAEEAVAAEGVLLDFLASLLDKKVDEPGDDLMSRLATDQLKTGLMTRAEVVSICKLVLLGGFDTTSNMIALGTVALLQNPTVLAELQTTDDPALVANAVEELLRYLTILHFGRRRVALEDVEVGGQLVRAGEGVIISHDAADRDPAAFPEPDQLDIHRRARHHLAFGYGIHQCLGQNLARVELQAVYGTLYRRIPTLALAVPADELPYKYDSVIYGVHQLPVTWTA